MLIVIVSAGLGACGGGEPTSPERYAASDELFDQVLANVDTAPDLEIIAEIDHSRLGAEAGSAMPPARVLLFSNPSLDAVLVQKNPLVALDLPFRVLAHEVTASGHSQVIYNTFAFVRTRHGLDQLATLEQRYEGYMVTALAGIEATQVGQFERNEVSIDSITTLESPLDFETTAELIQATIDSQEDALTFGVVDFQDRSQDIGMMIRPATLFLFGAPGPGAKAMSEAPTLGLDAFCQKMLVWEDREGAVHVSWNHLPALAERQGVGVNLPLRVITKRMNDLFEGAVQP